MKYAVSLIVAVAFVAIAGTIGVWFLGRADDRFEVRSQDEVIVSAEDAPIVDPGELVSDRRNRQVTVVESAPVDEPPDIRVVPVESDPPKVPLSVVAWNVESDGNDPAVIAERLSTFNDDVICLSEVHPDSVERYKSVLSRYTPMLSRSGRGDRLMIFVSDRFEILETKEMDDINDGRHRSPIYVRLKDKEGGATLVFLTVHLARGNAEFRTEQARRLREWARDETWPVIAIGDFNMDWDFRTQQGNEAFAEIMRDGVFRWLKPEPLVDTNWSAGRDGKDRYPDSMLDFAFAANAATEWNIESSVIVESGDFPDDDRTSDHRAVRVVLAP